MENEEKHEKIIKEIEEAILKVTKAKTTINFDYKVSNKDTILSVDLIVLIDFKIILFEIKSGIKERKARKQLLFHKKAFINSQNKGFPIRNVFFSEIKTFWVSYQNRKVVNTETNKAIEYTGFINNPLTFLLKE